MASKLSDFQKSFGFKKSDSGAGFFTKMFQGEIPEDYYLGTPYPASEPISRHRDYWETHIESGYAERYLKEKLKKKKIPAAYKKQSFSDFLDTIGVQYKAYGGKIQRKAGRSSETR